MAAITFAERIQDDLALLVADQSLIDLSRQRDATATEDTSRTLRVCQMAAAKLEGILGDAGSYDDTDVTIGDLQMLDLGVRLALRYYASVYSLTLTAEKQGLVEGIMAEAEALAKSRRQANSTPVVSVADNDDLNARHDNSTWADDDDTDA